MVKYLCLHVAAFLPIHAYSNTEAWWTSRWPGWKTEHSCKKPSFILQKASTNADFYAQAPWGLAVHSWGCVDSIAYMSDPSRMAEVRSFHTSFCWRRLHSDCSDLPDLRILATANEPQEVHEIKAHFKICPNWTIPHCRNNTSKGQEQHILQVPKASFQSFNHSVAIFSLHLRQTERNILSHLSETPI